MQITCNTKKLLAAVTACCRVAKRNGVKPVLEQLRLTADGDSVRIFATDLERSVSLSVLAEVTEAGSCLISSQRFRSALSQESGETVSVSHAGNEVQLCGDNSTMRWGTVEDSMPSVNADESQANVTMPCSVLASAFRAVGWSADECSTRYTLGGVMIDCTDGETNFVATDGKALAAYGPLQAPTKEASAIVPIGSCSAVAAIVPDDGECQICISANDVHFRFEGGFFVARQLEGRFPKWRDAIPAGQKVSVDVPAGVLSGMIAKCILMRVEGDASAVRQIETEFAIGGGKLITSAKSEVGESRAETIIASDAAITFHIDSAYVSDALRPMDPAGNVEVQLVDATTAVLFRQGILRCLIVPLS